MPKRKHSTPTSLKTSKKAKTQPVKNQAVKKVRPKPAEKPTVMIDPMHTQPQSFWQKLLHWFDKNILLLLSGFLLAFIPLYPKIPLADLIPGYIVRLRLEDLFVAATALIFIIQVLRKKVEWQSRVAWVIVAYAIVGLLSTISAVVVTQTVPAELLHVGKTALHYFRYLQYFSLFFVAYSAIKKKRDLWLLFIIFALTVIAVSLYGYGQKFYYWPVYSTMNREFSKGMRLYLTEHARVQSTFGGHYDMSAYLVIALPGLLAAAYTQRRKAVKLFLFLAYLLGTWLIIMGGSRSSFGGFLVGVTIVLGLTAFQQPKWWKKIWWGVSRGVFMYVVLVWMFIKFGDSMYERFLQTIEAYPSLRDAYHITNDRRRHFKRDYIDPFVASPAAQLKFLSFLTSKKAEPPKDAISTDELNNIIVSSDTQPTPQDPSTPSDVYVNVPDIVYEATIEGGVATVVAVEKPRTYSANAATQGLSMAIRLDTLWPRALQGFYKNPLLGSGYATLTKEAKYHFTEAESTDNNFLRTLGETGLLGFITFYGAVAIASLYAFLTLFKTSDTIIQGIAIGFLGATAGLLLNAVFIDVFAASKVAFTYWLFTGMMMAAAIKIAGVQLKFPNRFLSKRNTETEE